LYKSVHNLFSYRGHRQTDRHTYRQTNAGFERTLKSLIYRIVSYCIVWWCHWWCDVKT